MDGNRVCGNAPDGRVSELNAFCMALEISVLSFAGADPLKAFCDFYEIKEHRDLEPEPVEGGLCEGLEDLAGDAGRLAAAETERLFGLPLRVTRFADDGPLREQLEGPDGLAPFFFVFGILFCEYGGFTLCFLSGTNN